jgi:hypothetical protein
MGDVIEFDHGTLGGAHDCQAFLIRHRGVPFVARAACAACAACAISRNK